MTAKLIVEGTDKLLSGQEEGLIDCQTDRRMDIETTEETGRGTDHCD